MDQTSHKNLVTSYNKPLKETPGVRRIVTKKVFYVTVNFTAVCTLDFTSYTLMDVHIQEDEIIAVYLNPANRLPGEHLGDEEKLKGSLHGYLRMDQFRYIKIRTCL